MTARKINVAVLFGGRSAEHDVSRASAANVLRALDRDRDDVILIGISRDGRWLLCNSGNSAGDGAAELAIPDVGPEVALIPGGRGRLVLTTGEGSMPAMDVVFPVLHGPNGEDGTVQGVLEIADVPYVGSGVTGSATAMDKDVAKRLMRDGGLPVVPFITMLGSSPVGYAEAAAALRTTDLFVKPANMGSSVGVSRASSEQELAAACKLALAYDTKILVEQSVTGAREIECSVLEEADGQIRVSLAGEIVPASKHGFYSYDVKYIDAGGADLVIPAAVTPDQTARFQELAARAFQLLCCEGMARVDFFLTGDDIFLNEINTLPGFTSISMYPKLWEASGLPAAALMDKLIAHALARHARRPALTTR